MVLQTPRKSPAYVSIADSVRQWIESGEYAPGERIPNERELVEHFGAARMTVRHALDILQMEGFIDRKRGRTGGTFVRPIPPKVELTHIEGLWPQLEGMGYTLSTRVVACTLVNSSSQVSGALELPAQSPVFYVSRVRYIDDSPLCVEHSYYPKSLIPDLPSKDLSLSSHDFLVQHTGQQVTERRDVITPSVASDTEQQQLGISRTVPVLKMQSSYLAGNGDVLQYSEDVLRSDIMRVSVVTGESTNAPAS